VDLFVYLSLGPFPEILLSTLSVKDSQDNEICGFFSHSIRIGNTQREVCSVRRV